MILAARASYNFLRKKLCFESEETLRLAGNYSAPSLQTYWFRKRSKARLCLQIQIFSFKKLRCQLDTSLTTLASLFHQKKMHVFSEKQGGSLAVARSCRGLSKASLVPMKGMLIVS